MDVKHIINIIKPSEDKKLYRGLILPNQLRVLLISDPETDKSAAALKVSVGSMSDPDDLPGLAHFCEHMLFEGSNKYPSQNEYFEFFSSKHGSAHTGAFTSYDHTVYHFDIHSERLKDALDRFAHLLLCPLMRESAIAYEVNRVQSEHEQYVSQDFNRIHQLRKSLAKSNHPYTKYKGGNKATLATLPQEKGIDVRKELLNFHEKWYSSNIMTLIVLGKESLEELEEMTVSLFSQIENKNVTPPEWTDHPFGPDQIGTKTYVVPLKDKQEIFICFPIPDLREHYKAKPLEYIIRLLNDRSCGSLCSEIKGRKWADSFFFYSESPAKGFDLFTIKLDDVTDRGVVDLDDIIALIFQYLKFLRKSGPQKWIFMENKKNSELKFRFESEIDPTDYFRDVDGHDYPLEEMLSGPYLVSEWNPDLIDKILSDYLKPSNVMVTVVSKFFGEIATEVEPWYGTKYKVEKIPERTINNWENCPVIDLPRPNEYIPTNFDIYRNTNGKSQGCFPLVIYEDSSTNTKVWFKQDDEFLLPRVNVHFSFENPLIRCNPLNRNLTKIFVQLLKNALDESIYLTTLAGFSYKIMVSDHENLKLYVRGYSDKIISLIDKIFETVTNFTVDPNRFEVLKEKRIRNLSNFEFKKPKKQAQFYLKRLLGEKSWTKEDMIHSALYDMTVESLELFIPEVLSTLTCVGCLIHGNIAEEEAHAVTKILKSRIVSKIKKDEVKERKVVLNLIDKVNVLVKEIVDEHEKLSYVVNFYKFDLSSSKIGKTLAKLLKQIMFEAYSGETSLVVRQLKIGVWIYATTISCSDEGLKLTLEYYEHPLMCSIKESKFFYFKYET